MAEQVIFRLIDGNCVDKDRVIAYCHLDTHRGYLSKTLVKSHDCITKECPFFKKLKPEYWESLKAAEELRKSKRINRKRIRAKQAEMVKNREQIVREILEVNGHIFVTSIREQRSNLLVITYIYDQRVDLSDEIKLLRERLGKIIKLEAKIATAENIEILIRKRNLQDEDEN